MRDDKLVASFLLLPANFELDEKTSQKDSLAIMCSFKMAASKSYAMELFTQIKMLCRVLLMPKKKMESCYFLVD